MKTEEEIRAMFPLTLDVTQEIIYEADIWNNTKCIGALTLKQAFPDNKVTWGVTIGHVYIGDGISVELTTKYKYHMTDIKSPMKITFILW